MTIRIEPAPGMNVPRRELHDALCHCPDCRTRPPVPITVVPWAPQRVEARGREPVATLEYEGVRIELALSYLHSLSYSFENGSTFRESARVFEAALHEIEIRMWRHYNAWRDANAARSP